MTEKIIEDRRNGMNVAAIARKHGKERWFVEMVLKSSGMSTNRITKNMRSL